MEACVWRCLKLSVKLWPLEHAMLRGRLTQGCLGLLATRQEMMQVWIVTWIPEAQTGIRLDWGRGETRLSRCCRTHQIRAKKKVGGELSLGPSASGFWRLSSSACSLNAKRHDA